VHIPTPNDAKDAAMETIDPNVLGTLSIAGGVGVAMLVLGMKSKMLEFRAHQAQCPSCRRLVRRGTVCPCTH
jgi:hypothetical protein